MSGIKEKVRNLAKKSSILRFTYRGFRKMFFISCDMFHKKDKYCIICGHKVGRFLPLKQDEDKLSLFREHHIIGGWISDNCRCPYCGSWDRIRWQNYVLKHHTDILNTACSVLHFAAEKSNEDLIRLNSQCRYITADIEAGKCDIAADITNMTMLVDKTFDYVIANHVMEHIPDEAKAVSEMKRVLKDDGTIILSFPVCTDMLTREDPSITDEAERWRLFGQSDHVRLYGTDFKERLESYGLAVKVYSPESELTDEEIIKYGFIRDDVSIFCTKK